MKGQGRSAHVPFKRTSSAAIPALQSALHGSHKPAASLIFLVSKLICHSLALPGAVSVTSKKLAEFARQRATAGPAVPVSPAARNALQNAKAELESPLKLKDQNNSIFEKAQ